MSSVMPVRCATNDGIGRPGLTSVEKRSTRRPPTTRTAPISVMPLAAGPPPVVSRSTTTNSTPASGRASVSCSRTRQRPASGSNRKRASFPRSAPRKRPPNSGSRPRAVNTRSSSSSAGAPAGRSARYSYSRCRMRPFPPLRPTRRLEREEPPPLRRRPRGLVPGGERAQLVFEAVELVPLPVLELLELVPPPGVERLERRRPVAVEAAESVFDGAHHTEGGDQRPLAERAVEHHA